MLVYLRDGSAQTIARAATPGTEIADQTFYLTQSQYTDIGPTSPSADPIMPGAWHGSHWSANFSVISMRARSCWTHPVSASQLLLASCCDSTWKHPIASGIRTPDLPLVRRTLYPLDQRGGHIQERWNCLTLIFHILIWRQLTKVMAGMERSDQSETSVLRSQQHMTVLEDFSCCQCQ